MISFRFINLLVPGDPAQFSIDGAAGTWTFDQEAAFAANKLAIETGGKCAETYAGEHPVGLIPAAAVDAAMAELLPLCLGASFITGRSVTINRSTPHSDLQILQSPLGPRFPRERSINGAEACVNNQQEFEEVMEAFLAAYAGAGATEKILLVTHHRLDAMACWSLEDLYLSATTILQVIAYTQKAIAPIAHKPSFFKYLTAAAARQHIAAPNHDVVKMRNDLIHDGSLTGSSFAGKTEAQCKAVTADVLNWIDTYFHAALNLGVVRRVRFNAGSFANLNAYSL